MFRKTSLPYFAALMLAAWGALALTQTRLAVADNSCIACHSQPRVDNATGKNYLDWKGSVHEENGVSCEACHQGNPASQEKGAAHRGVFKSGDARSTVYFKNVPATCGNCHGREYNQFSKSLHYQRLETTERGPNCVTCHGARATSIVTPPEMEELCTICHNERLGILPETPRVAHTTLLLMNQTQFILEVLNHYVKKVPGEEDALSQARAHLQLTSNSLKLSKLRWHTFELHAIESSTKEAWEAARSAWSKLNP